VAGNVCGPKQLEKLKSAIKYFGKRSMLYLGFRVLWNVWGPKWLEKLKSAIKYFGKEARYI
jgi:hypothetical protein